MPRPTETARKSDLIFNSTVTQVSFDGHRLKPFAGLEICVSGYVKKDYKATLGKLISEYGGLYNPELNRATCHVLVCEVPTGQKYK